MSDSIDFISNDMSCVALENTKTSCNNAHEQEVNDLMNFLKVEQSKYLQQKIIYDLIEDIINHDHMDPKLKSKVKEVMLSENVKQTSSIDTKAYKIKELPLLGVDKQNTVLTYSESSVLQEMLKMKLSENTTAITASHQSWADLVESNHQLQPLQIDSDDTVLLEYRNKLYVEQQKYIKNLANLHDLLEEIVEVRVKKLPELFEDKLKESQLVQKINHLKCTLADEKCNVDIFTETPCSLKAYNELINEVKEQQKDCQKQINDLKELKEKYKQISGKQYDDILKTYLQYKASLEKKKVLYNCIKS